MDPEELKKTLCAAFCGGIFVNPMASGYAISSAFEDNSGDRISFYLTPSDEGYSIEDDGSYLAHLIAKDIPIDQEQRGQLLEANLSSADASWDRDTFEIRTPIFSEKEIPPRRVVDFLSSMIRVRDLELLTREVVRSTFREDAIKALTKTLGHVAYLNEHQAVTSDFQDFPADIVIRPHVDLKSAKAGAVYFVNTNDKLNEALLLQMESRSLRRDDFEVIALVEEPNMRMISRKKFQRAQNRDLAMPIFREDEEGAMNFIRRRLGMPEQQAA